MLIVIVLNVVMLIVIRLNAVMLRVVNHTLDDSTIRSQMLRRSFILRNTRKYLQNDLSYIRHKCSHHRDSDSALFNFDTLH
jgi:hypothetical protein